MVRTLSRVRASSYVVIERLLESPYDAAHGQSKGSAAGSDIFVCACRRLPTSSGCSPRTTCVHASALPRRRRSTPRALASRAAAAVCAVP